MILANMVSAKTGSSIGERISDQGHALVPVWTIGTEPEKAERASALIEGTPLTPARLDQLRYALSAFADSPIVTLEAHPLPTTSDLSSGMRLEAASPLAQHLADLIARTSKALPTAVSRVDLSGDTLYRMVLPAKVAAQMGTGLVRSMPSNAVAGGIRSAVLGRAGIVAQSSFVPVAAAEGGVAGVAAVGVGAAGVASAMTVAGPLVVAALAVAVSVHAEQQRRQAIERVTELLQGLRQDSLDSERNRLGGCRPAIDKATAILLDKGQIGPSLGLDTAASTIDTAVESATNRAASWRKALNGLPDRAEFGDLEKALPGIGEVGGEFRAHLRLAALAVALKRRVLVLQAVEHAQLSTGNTFPRFVEALKRDQQSVDELEANITGILNALARLRLHAPRRFVDKIMTRGEVEALLDRADLLRELAISESVARAEPKDIEIEVARKADGSVVVFPARYVGETAHDPLTGRGD